MPLSLADLRVETARTDAPKARPERAATICLRPDLIAEVQSLTSELAVIDTLTAVDEDGNQSGPPRRTGQGEPPRVREIRDKLEKVVEEIAKHEGELKVRANLSDGEWRRWCNEHPARSEGEAGYARDMRIAAGLCNADDLIDTIGQFAYMWDGEPLSDTDWAQVFEPVVSGGDKNDLAAAIVAMYEKRVDFPQWRSDLSSILKRSSAFALPASSESLTSDSTAGSH